MERLMENPFKAIAEMFSAMVGAFTSGPSVQQPKPVKPGVNKPAPSQEGRKERTAPQATVKGAAEAAAPANDNPKDDIGKALDDVAKLAKELGLDKLLADAAKGLKSSEVTTNAQHMITGVLEGVTGGVTTVVEQVTKSTGFGK
jgi:hypothetical protein